MSEHNPFEGVAKRKRILLKQYKLHGECFHRKAGAEEVASEFRDKGYSARKYKKGKWWFVYIRKQ